MNISNMIAPPREFTLGGLRYTAPYKIGAGIQADIAQMQLAEYAKTEEYQNLTDIKAIQKAAKTPEEITLKMKSLEKEITNGFLMWSSKNIKKLTLITLEYLLTPCGDYPPMLDVYDQLATSEEVDAVTNFFKGKQTDNLDESNLSSNSEGSQTIAGQETQNISGQKKSGQKRKK